MKRLLFAALALSLAVNALYLARNSRPALPLDTQLARQAYSASLPHNQHETVPVFPAADWFTLQNGALSVRFLRQLGFSDAQLRAVVRAIVDARYATREHALRKTPAYWESKFDYGYLNPLDPWKDLVAARELLLQKETEFRRMLSDAAHPSPRGYASNLPFEKAWQLRLINDDYQRLRDQRRAAWPLRLPDPSDRYRYLSQQQRADIEALLTPDELNVYDLQNSGIASHLRSLSGFNSTEQEFLTLYKILRPTEPLYDPTLNDPKLHAELQKKEKMLEHQVHEALGEKRYADYQRAQDPAFRFNRELTALLNKPSETALAGYDTIKSLREKAAAFSSQKNLTESQRAAFRTSLLQEAEASFTALYGQNGYETARLTIASQLFRSQP